MSRVLLTNISKGRESSTRLLPRSATPVPAILYSLPPRQSLPFIITRRTISSIGRQPYLLNSSRPFVSSQIRLQLPTKRFPTLQVSPLHTTPIKATKKQPKKQQKEEKEEKEKRGHKIALIVISVAFILAAGQSIYAKVALSNPANEAELEYQYELSHLEHQFHTMQIPPGRPETLTPEQEQKLKELWQASLTVFGVGNTPSDSTGTSSTATRTTTPSESTTTDTTPDPSVKEKKKSRFGGLLRSKKDKDSGASISSATTTTSSTSTTAAAETTIPDVAIAATIARAEESDKYGQTADFKKALQDLQPSELRTAFWDMVKHDNPDGLLLRFLRARKWDVDKALVMMVSTMHWRLKEMNVEEVIKSGEGGAKEKGDDDFLKQIRMGKSYLHGTDKEGRPICTVRVRLHRANEQSEESLERYTVYIMETARLMLKNPVDTACVVFDMTDFGMSNMDYAPVKYLVKCFEAHYPESLGICLVHKAPWGFSTIWSIIRGWLDPVVAAKIHFTKNTEDLAKWIDLSKIPKELGGDEDWKYEYLEPVQGENDKIKDTEGLKKLRDQRMGQVERYEQLTREWIAAPLKTATSEDERVKEIKKQRNSIEKELERGYWDIDGHVRARTIYDRRGIINPGGRIVFYPDAVSTLSQGVEKLKVADAPVSSGDHTEVD